MLRSFLAVTLLLLVTAPPSFAVTVKIEAAAPIEDRSEASIAQALKGALEAAIRRAVEMGMEWVQFQGAKLAGDEVIVSMIATDDDMEEADTVPASAETWVPRTL